MEIVVRVLSAAGLWISIYFTGVYFKWFRPEVFWVPQVCRLDEKSCLNVLDTPRAKILGVPNSVFGIFVYSFILITGWAFLIPSVILLSFAVLRSVYLAYSLIFVTKIPCKLCFASHAVNLSLFFIFLSKVMG